MYRTHLSVATLTMAILTIGVALIASQFFVLPAHAREGHFQSAQGNILDSSPGDELVTVNENGSISAYSADGTLLPGFPFFTESIVVGGVIVSSPRIASIDGEGQNEIVFVSRELSDEHILHVMDGTGTMVHQVEIGTGAFFCDPTIVDLDGTDKQGIVIAKDDGTITWFRDAGGTIYTIPLLDAGVPVCTAWNSVTQELIINYPQLTKIDVYNETGSIWSLVRSLTTHEPILYSMTPIGVERWYGVDNNYDVVALDPLTGGLIAPFPVDFGAAPLASPLVAVVDETAPAGSVVVPVNGGKMITLAPDGTIFDPEESQYAADGVQLPSPDTLSGGVFANVRGLAVRAISDAGERIAGLFSTVRLYLFPERTGPVVSSLVASETEITEGTGAITITASAVHESENITAAEYHVRAPGDSSAIVPGTGVSLAATDGAFDSTSEQISGTVDTSSWTFSPTAYQVSVLAMQASGEWTEESAVIDITVTRAIAPPADDLIVDGDMESADTAGWSQVNSPDGFTKTTEGVYAGTQSLHITSQAGKYGGAAQHNIAVEAGKQYRLSFAYRFDSRFALTKLCINTCGPDIDGGSHFLSAPSDPTQWQNYVRTFRVPSDFTGDFIFLASARDGQLWLDEVEVVEIQPIVANGDFESDSTSPWVSVATPESVELTESFVYNGSQSLHVVTGAGVLAGVEQSALPVEAGKTYRMSMAYQFTGTFAVANLCLGSCTNEVSGSTYFLDSTATGRWRAIERTFTIPADFTGDFKVQIYTRDGEIFIDDVVIEPYQQLIVDGDMEAADTSAWENKRKPSVFEKSTTAVHEGSQSLYLVPRENKYSGVVQTGIPVEAGRTYQYSFWYQGDSTLLISRVCADTCGADISGKSKILRPEAGSWKYHTRNVTVPADFTGDFAILLYAKGGEMYFDDIQLKEVGG